MDKNCSNCKYWDEGKTFGVDDELCVSRCNRIPMFWDSTAWADDGQSRKFINDSKAFAQDGSDYNAYLLTKPDFYCNMWEGK